VDFSTFIERNFNARNFDAVMTSMQADPALGGIRQVWGSAGAAPGGQNTVNYVNPRFDALVDSATSVFDKTRSDAYAHRAYQLLVDDAPAVWLYDVPTMGALHKRVRPEHVRPDAWWSNLDEWWIPANERIDRDRIGLRPAQP
jgi:ABC-type transport system substrate-binding protein